MATMAFRGEPWMAREMAWRVAQVVKTAVDRPIQVATVRGLKRKLQDTLRKVAIGIRSHGESYAAATTRAEAFFARRGEENNRDWPASPDSAIFERASALKMSTTV